MSVVLTEYPRGGGFQRQKRIRLCTVWEEKNARLLRSDIILYGTDGARLSHRDFLVDRQAGVQSSR